MGALIGTGAGDLLSFLNGQVTDLTPSAGGTNALINAALINALQRRRIAVVMPADAAAGTTGTYNLADISNTSGTITRITVVPNAALAADPANNAVLTYQVANGTGGGAVAFTSAATTNAGGTGSWSANNRVAGAAGIVLLTTSAKSWLAASFPAGAVIQENIAKGGTGVVVPQRVITIDYLEEGP